MPTSPSGHRPAATHGAIVHRPKRLPPKRPQVTRFDLPRVPDELPAPGLRASMFVMPLMAGGGFLILGVTTDSSRGRLVVVGVGFVMLALSVTLLYRWLTNREARNRARAQVDSFFIALERVNRAAESEKKVVVETLDDRHPPTESFESRVADGSVWRRRLPDADFLTVCLGKGEARSSLSLDTSTLRGAQNSDVLRRVRSVARAVEWLSEAPVEHDLRDRRVLAVSGERAAALALSRAIVAELAIECGPDELQVGALVPPTGDDVPPEWKWLTALPHSQRVEDPAKGSLVFTSVAQFELGLADAVRRRLTTKRDRDDGSSHAWSTLLVVVDRYSPLSELQNAETLSLMLSRAAELDVCAIVICDDATSRPESCDALVELTETAGVVSDLASDSRSVCTLAPRAMSLSAVDALVALLGSVTLASDAARVASARSDRLVDVLNLSERMGSAFDWTDERGPLELPIGLDDRGRELHLNIEEAALGGDGPHGIVIGATGTGKSELLRSMVAGAASLHHPAHLNFLFVDFKGGATFEPFADLPHTVGLITNLETEPYLVDRMQAALEGLLAQRQVDLRRAGRNVSKLTDYDRARSVDPTLPRLPRVLVVCDEFGELLLARPDFFESFARIARLGRSLGLHLLVATQRLEGKMSALMSHLSYRVCLRTFSTEDSVAVLGSRVAADLPTRPGVGMLKTSDDVRRFDALRTDQDSALTEGESDLEAVAAALQSAAVDRLPALWLDPLPDSAAGDQVLVLSDPRIATSSLDDFEIPLGLVDRPRVPAQPVYRHSLNARGGHLLIVGAPRTGKTVALATLLLSSCDAIGAENLEVIGLDFGAGDLLPARALPTVTAIAGLDDDDRIDRCIDRALSELDARLAHGSVASRLLVIVDNVGSGRSRRPDLDDVLLRLTDAGPQVGIHVVLTATRASDVPSKIVDRVATRLEFALAEQALSVVPRTVGANNRVCAGRAVDDRGQLVQIAAPTEAESTFEAAVRERVGTKPALPRLRVLDDLSRREFELAEANVRSSGHVLLGVSARDFEPVVIDVSDHRPLLVLGTNDDRTSVYERVARELHSMSDRLDLVSVNASLDDSVPFATSPAEAFELEHKVCSSLADWWDSEGVAGASRERRCVLLWSGFELLHEFAATPLLKSNEDRVPPLDAIIRLSLPLSVKLILFLDIDGLAARQSDPLLKAAMTLGPNALLLGEANDLTTSSILRFPSARRPQRGRGRYVRQGEVGLVVQVDPPEIVDSEKGRSSRTGGHARKKG